MIVKSGPGKWTLFTKDGRRVLGRHPSKEAAEAQERAIYARKAAAGK